MKKIVLLFSVFILFFSMSLRAQNTLTVADGTGSSGRVPVYGYYTDSYQRCQVIYPADMLAEMTETDISAVTFHLTSLPSSAWTSVFEVKLGITSTNSFPNTYFLTDSVTTLYTGTLTFAADSTMTVTFDAPFVYNGGNLLLEFASTTKGNWFSANFFGVSATDASLSGYNYNTTGPSISSGAKQSFIPKTTFTVTYHDTCSPSSLAVSEIMGSSAYVTWRKGHSVTTYPYEVSYRAVGDASWTVAAASTTDNSLFLSGLQPQTDYQVRVRSFCGDGTSDGATTTFTTDCSGGHSQPVTIAPETRTNLSGYIPFSTSYAYTYSQQIFTAEEIGGARTIDGIFLQHIGTPATRNIDIYIGHTTKASFSNGSSWEAISNLTQVHSGEMSFSSDVNNGYWFWIPFDSAFSYNGTDNLVIAFDDNTGSAISYVDRFYTHYIYGRTLYAYNSSTNINPASPVSGYTGSYRTNLRLPGECLTEDCDRSNLLVTNITDATAQLQFIAGNGASGIELQYKRTDENTFTTVTITGNTHQLTGLKHNTAYTARIRSLCAGSESSWKEVNFTTMPKYYPIIYVSTDGTGDGGSWATATNDLNWAVNTAAAIHNTFGSWADVWVKEGTYYGDTTAESAFTIVEDIWVYGGFTGTETNLSQRDFYNHPTYLDGQHSRRVLNQPTGYSEQSLWDGFTIQNGYSTNGPGGAYLRNNTYLYDCEIINNTGTSGGGVTAYYASLDNCRFRGNVSTGTYSSDGGGALRSTYSTINRCTFTHNRAAKYGGAIYITDANSYNINLSNCLIANNTAASGGGIYSTASGAVIHNSSIVNNEATTSGAGIYATSVKRIANSIIWGNRTTSGTVSSINGSTIDCFYSAVEGGYSGEGNVILLPDSLLGGVFAPKFVNPSATVGYTDNTPNPNWHLQNGSVCANRGNNSYVSNNSTDLDFNTRILNDTVDMGCYESNFFLVPLPEYGDVIYVTQNGSGSRDGSSWANATNDILLGMSLASMYHASVWVAEGVYYGDTTAYNAFTLLDGVNMYGGFAGNETSLVQRDIAAHVTALDGGNVRRVLDQPIVFNNRTILDGFTIQHGVSPSSTGNTGGGARLKANITVSNCTFTNNQSSYGGAVYADGYDYYFTSSDSIYLLNCTFAYNTATSNCGAAELRRNIAIRNCTFTHNTSSGSCGGLSVDECTVSHCVFTHNTAGGSTGGLSASESVVSNCLVANNSSATGGSGISCDRAEIYNCTVVNNASSSPYGQSSGASNTTIAGAGFSTGTSTSYISTVKNCIIWGNRHNGAPSNYDGVSPCDHSAVEGGANGNDNIVLISANSGASPFSPHFVHPSDSVGAFNTPDSSDWRLADGSPCVNRGDNTVATATDLAGNIRISQDTIDIGCYESEYNSVAMPEYGNIIYVTVEGAGTQLGDSWENAIPSLTDAISIAKAYGANVWVAAGSYYGNTSGSSAFLMAEGVSVYGGFAGNEPADYDLSQRDFETNTTILDGQYMRRVIYQPYNFTDSTAVVWDGFTIQNGAWCERGTGVYMLAYTTLSNCIIQNNYTYYRSAQAYSSVSVYGAGVYAVGSGSATTGYSTSIKNCIIRYNSFENYSYLYGRGAGLWCTNINLSHTEICHNTGYEEGGGMYGSGIKASNCLIHSNQGYRGGGCYIGGSVEFTNCDIVNNRVTGYNCYGGGIYHNSGTNVFTNCIIWGNQRYYTVENIYGSGTYTYCAVEGGRTGTGNLNLAAANDGYDDTQLYVRFIDPVNGDFSLHATSACVNTGNSDAVTDTLDLFGNPRLNSVVDIGCSEVQEFSDCPSVVALQADNITGTSALLSWHSLGTESQWFVVYGIEGGATDTMTVTDTICTLTGLTLNRNYTAKVRAVCGDGLTSIFSLPIHFQTICDPAALDTLSNFSVMLPGDSSLVYQDGVSFSWANLPEATSYDLYVWAADGTEPETPTLAGLTYAGANNVQLPAYERGKWYRWKVVAWNECISKASPVMNLRVNPLPDLHVSAVTVSTPMAGQPLTVTWTVINDGEGSTSTGNAWSDRIWLARDLDVREYNYDQDVNLATVANLQVLNPGESYTNTATVTLPEGIMGNYYLFVIANQHDAYSIDLDPVGGSAPDPYTPSVTGIPYPYLNGLCHSRDMEEVTYYDYHNGFNHFYGMDDFFYVVLNILPPPSPDLVVSSVAHPANTFSGTTIPLTWTVTNQGEATAMGSWYDVVYLTADTILNTADALRVGTYKHTGNLPIDSSYSRNIEVTIPIEYVGDYRFFVITDNNEEIYEGFFDDNNTGVSGHPLTVTLTPPADLIVTSIVMPDTLDVNTTYNIFFTVKNNGSSPTFGNSWYDNVYISQDSVFNRSNARLLRRIGHSGVLAADASYNKEYPVSIPADLEGGLWYLFVSTDDYSNIFEYTYEDNNVTSIPIIVALPDLVVTAIHVPDTVDPNTTVRVTWTVRNNGPGNAIRRTFTDHLRFNGETTYTASTSNLDMAAGDSIVRSAFVTLSCPTDTAMLSAVTDVTDAVMENDENNNTLTVPLDIHTPDLTVTGVTLFADTLWSGTPVSISYIVVNNGDMPVSGTVTDHFYFNQQSASFAEGDLAGTHTYTLALAPGATETVTATVNVPNGISGQYYCHVTGNATGAVCETNFENNFGHSAAFNVQLSPWPDIVVTNVTVEGPVHLGGTFPVQYTIANQGAAPLQYAAANHKFYYSTTATQYDTNHLIHTQLDYLNIPAGGEGTFTAYMALPADETPRSYYIHIVADANNQVYEHTDEGNNTAVSNSFVATVYQLDLTAVEIDGPNEMQWGQTATYRLHVRNNSAVQTLVSQWYDVLYLSEDQTLQNYDQFMQGMNHQGVLNAGNDYWVNFSVTIPYGTPATAYLLGYTDFYNSNPDINPFNNSVAKAITVSSLPTPDIAITDATILGEVISGQPVRLAYTVSNTGEQDIVLQTWTDKLFLSADDSYESGDLELLTKQRQNVTLPQGGVYTDTLTFTVPLPYSGNMYLIVKANTNNNPFEANLANNTAVLPMNIVLTDPGDLVVTDITSDSAVVSGSLFHVSWNVQNIGENLLSGSGLRSLVYISSDMEFDANDRLIGNIVNPQIFLNPGDMLAQSLECRISGLAEGEYYLIVKTDVTNAFYEVDETNNSGCSLEPFAVTIRPLPFNTDVADVLYNDSPSDFRMEVGDQIGQTVRLHLTSEDSLAGAINMIYTTYNGMGDNLSYSYATIGQYTANPELYIPSTGAGYYGVNVYGNTPAGSEQNTVIRADILPFELLSVDADHGGNTGEVTVELTGSHFRPDMKVCLRNADDTICADSLIYVNYYKAFAKFDLTGRTPGVYDVSAENFCEGESVLHDGFTIEGGFSDGLVYNLIFPSSPRPNRSLVMMLEFANLGNTDLHDQVLEITCNGGCPIGLTPEDVTLGSTTILVPLSIEGQPEGLLRPGCYGTLNIYGYTSGALVFTLKPVEQ
jgi:predicted outer membrane repeat protein